MTGGANCVALNKRRVNLEETMTQSYPAGGSGRWLQLLAGVICMSMIANLQYGWTFFVNPIQDRHGWDKASIQVAFSLFVVMETWRVPIEGLFGDKYGPRFVVLFCGVLCGVEWCIKSYADSFSILYVDSVI